MMTLISCCGCGVVYDLSALEFPSPEDPDNTVWDGDAMEYVPFIECRVCDTALPKPVK